MLSELPLSLSFHGLPLYDAHNMFTKAYSVIHFPQVPESDFAHGCQVRPFPLMLSFFIFSQNAFLWCLEHFYRAYSIIHFPQAPKSNFAHGCRVRLFLLMLLFSLSFHRIPLMLAKVCIFTHFSQVSKSDFVHGCQVRSFHWCSLFVHLFMECLFIMLPIFFKGLYCYPLPSSVWVWLCAWLLN